MMKDPKALNASSTLFISSLFFSCYLCFLPYIFPLTYIRVVNFLFTFFPICHSDVLKIQNTHFSCRLRPFSVSPKLSFDVQPKAHHYNVSVRVSAGQTRVTITKWGPICFPNEHIVLHNRDINIQPLLTTPKLFFFILGCQLFSRFNYSIALAAL